MASRKGSVKPKNRFLATLVTGDRLPCAFCQREIDDEVTYGKLYAIGSVQVHYFCVLLSCCLVQKGRDTEGLFGFLYPDIIVELERSKKHKCSYCGTGGASVGCCVAQCRKQFHLPCGRDKNAVSLFYGNYKSYCQQHVPKQKIPDHIMEVAKVRKRRAKHALLTPTSPGGVKLSDGTSSNPLTVPEPESVCVICYEAVPGYPTVTTFWPPCCARDAWFHRTCLQRMALSAGMHYLKCPLCNDKEQFYDAVVSQGYYVPDRDAAWELEQNAFAEIYERTAACDAAVCLCPKGRAHDADTGEWDIRLCLLCGTTGCHVACLRAGGGAVCAAAGPGPTACDNKEDSNDSVRPLRYVCEICNSCAPEDMETLAGRIEAVILAEQRSSRQRSIRPIMATRMSLRRTKARIAKEDFPSTSNINADIEKASDNPEASADAKDTKKTLTASRLELNLPTPRRPLAQPPSVLRNIENKLLSPVRLIEENITKKIKSLGVEDEKEREIVNKVKQRLKKPRPLCEKKKIVNSVLDQLFEDMIFKLSPLKSSTPKKSNIEIAEKIKREVSAQNTPEKLPNGRSPEILPSVEDVGNNEAIDDDYDSSHSTFHLPPEFIAEQNSDDNMSLFETPKKFNYNITKDSSMEIDKQDEVGNANGAGGVKMEEKDNKEINKTVKIRSKKKKRVFKFDSKDKEEMVKKETDINLDSFKSYYLNEVEKDFKCGFNHKHEGGQKKGKSKLRTAIDFAYDAYKKNRTDGEKRKQLKRKKEKLQDGVPKKKSKKDNELVIEVNNSPENSIDVTLDTQRKKEKKKMKKYENKKRRENNNIQVKIRFKKEQVKFKITQSQTKKPKKTKRRSVMTQYILNMAENTSSNKMLTKPDQIVSPHKRKYIKLDKSPDNLVQTSIQNFFTKVPCSSDSK